MEERKKKLEDWKERKGGYKAKRPQNYLLDDQGWSSEPKTCPVVLDRKIKKNETWSELAGGHVVRKTTEFSVPEEEWAKLSTETVHLVKRWKRKQSNMEALPACWKLTLQIEDLHTAGQEK